MNVKIVGISIVIFLAAIIPLSYVHELGHSYICMMEGHDFDIELGIDGGRMVCFGEVENQFLFRNLSNFSFKNSFSEINSSLEVKFALYFDKSG